MYSDPRIPKIAKSVLGRICYLQTFISIAAKCSIKYVLILPLLVAKSRKDCYSNDKNFKY